MAEELGIHERIIFNWKKKEPSQIIPNLSGDLF
jgi:hypothetical protein